MRTLRFSASLTVLFSTLLSGVVGLLVGFVFFISHLLSHIGDWANINMGFAFQIWMLTAMHGLVMYAIPSLLTGIALIFFLDRGMASSRFFLISLLVAVVMTIWAVVTVEFTGSLILVFVLSAIAMYGFLWWVTVPVEQRQTTSLFDGLDKS
ncbi:MAG: hypothetical protein SOX43_08895 [Pelistega sp.]|nr:hypothetical protein [Pelistega sp.]